MIKASKHRGFARHRWILRHGCHRRSVWRGKPLAAPCAGLPLSLPARLLCKPTFVELRFCNGALQRAVAPPISFAGRRTLGAVAGLGLPTPAAGRDADGGHLRCWGATGRPASAAAGPMPLPAKHGPKSGRRSGAEALGSAAVRGGLVAARGRHEQGDGEIGGPAPALSLSGDTWAVGLHRAR